MFAGVNRDMSPDLPDGSKRKTRFTIMHELEGKTPQEVEEEAKAEREKERQEWEAEQKRLTDARADEANADAEALAGNDMKFRRVAVADFSGEGTDIPG